MVYNAHINVGFMITELEIRHAMSKSQSNASAARVLGVSNATYKKYADLYIDKDTGKTLYELHKNQSGKGVKESSSNLAKRWEDRLERLLLGEIRRHPRMTLSYLNLRILKSNLILKKCYQCGYDEMRVGDDRVPLIVTYKDGDDCNLKIDNIELLCYNCAFQNGINLMVTKRDWA